MITKEDIIPHDDGVIIKIGDQEYLFETREEDLVVCEVCSDFLIFNITKQRYECPVCGFETDINE